MMCSSACANVPFMPSATAVVELAGVVTTILVDHQRAGDGTGLEQAMPVLVGARREREASSEKMTPTCPVATWLGELLEVLSVGGARARLAEIPVEDVDPISGLQPRDCALFLRLYWRSVLSWLKRTCPCVD